MMVVIVEFELRVGAESEFETALQDMQERVKNFDGYLGETPCRSVEDERRFITLFYWSNRESIKAWRDDAEHTRVRQLGREKVLVGYKIRVCEVEREYDWEWLE